MLLFRACAGWFCEYVSAQRLIYKDRDGDLKILNMETNQTEVLIKNATFVSDVIQTIQVFQMEKLQKLKKTISYATNMKHGSLLWTLQS